MDAEPVAVVREMWEAFGENRMDDALALMHPQAIWTPFTRPARTAYIGRDAIRQFREDAARVWEPFRTEVTDYVRQADGSVICRGLAVAEDDHAPFIKVAFEARCIVHGDLVMSIDTNEVVESAD